MEVAGGILSRTDPGMHISRMGGGGGRLRWKEKRMEQTYAADDDK